MIKNNEIKKERNKEKERLWKTAITHNQQF